MLNLPYGPFLTRGVAIFMFPTMDCTSTLIPYGQTGFFSRIVTDYVNRSPRLQPFYKHPVSGEGIRAAIEARKAFAPHRALLVEELKKQYAQLPPAPAVQENVGKLLLDNTFTITTAHQPAIFTGNLYFIYKILHVVGLAEKLRTELPQYHFLPMFYMGSEDADLDELGKIYLDKDLLVWNAGQTGAVGRMKPKGLEPLLHRIEGEFSVQPFGRELVQLLKDCYLQSPDIQTATLKLLHALFAEYGLIVLIPDNASFKQVMQQVFQDDLFRQLPSTIVQGTIGRLSEQYKVQANPRAINLFYLEGDIRGRIEQQGDHWQVNGQPISFTADALKQELEGHPERFSPNVILRGLMQETILPNIAFIGGGGETAYWLELKELFEHYGVPYPMLVIRNSFLLIEEKWKTVMHKLQLGTGELFVSSRDLINGRILQQSNGQIRLEKELTAASDLYDHLKAKAARIDRSLEQHIDALQTKTMHRLQELEKKLLRAERKKHADEQRQIDVLKSALFPFDSLQERIDNFMPYYAKWGRDFIRVIYEHSLTLEQEFTVLTEK